MGDVVERGSPEDDGEDAKDNERTEQRYAEPASNKQYGVGSGPNFRKKKQRYAEPASNKQYGVGSGPNFRKKKWTRGNDSLFIFVTPVYSILIPRVLCCIYY